MLTGGNAADSAGFRTKSPPIGLAGFFVFRVAQAALRREADGTRFRLLGVGLSGLAPGAEADPVALIDTGDGKRAKAERAMDQIRAKFGGEAVGKGRGLARYRTRGR